MCKSWLWSRLEHPFSRVLLLLKEVKHKIILNRSCKVIYDIFRASETETYKNTLKVHKNGHIIGDNIEAANHTSWFKSYLCLQQNDLTNYYYSNLCNRIILKTLSFIVIASVITEHIGTASVINENVKFDIDKSCWRIVITEIEKTMNIIHQYDAFQKWCRSARKWPMRQVPLSVLCIRDFRRYLIPEGRKVTLQSLS